MVFVKMENVSATKDLLESTVILLCVKIHVPTTDIALWVNADVM